MKRLNYWIVFSMVTATAVAQVPPTMWERTYRGHSHDVGYSVQPLTDGGFVVGGSTDSFGAGGIDMWLLRIDSLGDSLWSQTYGGPGDETCYGLAILTDGLLLAGVTTSFGAGGEDMWIIRADEDGDSLWSRTYGGPDNDRCNAVLPTADGGFLLGGGGVHHGRETEDINVVKVNTNGDSLWSLVLGGTVNALAATSDGNYVAAGYWGSAWPGDAYFWLVKFTDAGAVLWDQVYNSNCGDQCRSVQETDGGFALFGYSRISCGLEEHWLLRTDADGNYTDSFGYSGSSYDYGYAGLRATDGGYVLAGLTWSFGAGQRDVWLVKADSEGNLLWSQTYGGSADDGGWVVVETSERSYIIVGNTQSFGAGGQDVYVIKTGSDDSILPVELLSFEAVPGDRQIELHWSTASESELDRFEIAHDGSIVARIPAMNHATGHNYAWLDTGLMNGILYNYELTAVDLSGARELLASVTAAPRAAPETVTDFQLLQNYPNPFNLSTTIRFQLPEESTVRIIIYNAAGQQIATLVDDATSAGAHEVTWDGRDAAGEIVAAGIYFSKFTARSFTQTRKMVLLK